MPDEIDSYTNAGVDYDQLDALKRYAQVAAVATEHKLPGGMMAVPASRGESAFVLDIGPFYIATVQEGLGTKNLIAEAVDTPEETHMVKIGWDTVATIVNDLAAVGAQPLLVNAHWAIGGSKWLAHVHRGKNLAIGWASACIEAGAVYAAGETPMLNGIIYPETVELSGSAVGIIDPKERLTLGDKLCPGDHVILIESSGIHANGLTLVREVAKDLPGGYGTTLGARGTFGEALLMPTHIYVGLVQALFKESVDIHYVVHITGHGWSKLMRANQEFTYRIHTVPEPQKEFGLIQQTAQVPDREMYGTFNMGAGFAFMVPPDQAEVVVRIAAKLGFQAWDAGVVEEGPKQVIIEPIGVTYGADTLNIR